MLKKFETPKDTPVSEEEVAMEIDPKDLDKKGMHVISGQEDEFDLASEVPDDDPASKFLKEHDE